MELSSPVKTRAARYITIYLGVILFIFAFGGGVLVGDWWRARKQISPQYVNEITKVVNFNRATNHSDTVDFAQFWQVWDKIKQKYVKQPVKDVDLFYGALQGLVGGLGDPYSVYFPPKAAQDFDKSLAGELSGIGAEIGIKNNQLLIIAPLPNSPAEKVGLRPGDKILAIDKKITAGMDVSTAVEHIRGVAGTTTTLVIARDGMEKPVEMVITRATINVPAVLFSMKRNNIAYLRIMQFNNRTMPEFNNYIAKLRKQKITGLIIDLRNNPGGYLDSAVAMASKWIPEGVIVSEKFANGRDNTHDTEGNHPLQGVKTAVLVNGGSASASEIVSGALQDYKAATLIGEKTFGKGLVQDLESLPDGSALKVTIAEWFTPKGHNINEKGITPDIEVKEDYEKEKVGEDAVIDKAIEVLR